MWGCSFFIALILAWPTMGLSLVAWLVALLLSARSERRLNEYRDARRMSPTSTSAWAPRPEKITAGIQALLQHIAALPQAEAAGIYRELDVTDLGERLEAVTEAGYMRAAARYGLNNLDALTVHIMTIAVAANQRRVTQSDQEASMRSILYWCIENGARADRDGFYRVDIAAASRKGAKADRRMIG